MITTISIGNKKDIDIAVDAAHKAFDTTWGLNTPGSVRGHMLMKLADLMEENKDELAALEALDNGSFWFIFHIGVKISNEGMGL